MPRKSSNLQDYGIEEDVDPRIKFNSLLSATVSTIMCLAAKCPLPRSNVETTKLFLSKITDDGGETPRNVKGFLSLLNDYSGPYDGEPFRKRFEKSPPRKPIEKKPSLEPMSLIPRTTPSQLLGKEVISVDGPMPTKRTTRILVRKTERETIRKANRTSGPRVSPSRSVISSKS